MRQTFKITKADDPKDVTMVNMDARDVLVWERTNRRGRTAEHIGRSATAEDCYDLAYLAARRSGRLDVARKEFEAEYLVEAVDEVEEEDPTNQGR